MLRRFISPPGNKIYFIQFFHLLVCQASVLRNGATLQPNSPLCYSPYRYRNLILILDRYTCNEVIFYIPPSPTPSTPFSTSSNIGFYCIGYFYIEDKTDIQIFCSSFKRLYSKGFEGGFY